ncbi:transport and Golgi organization protein 2-like isoform X1 [Rhagoletis pomonella]|uniref:transport and Golgi organization protein 2-like isoform X1 n=1 Tax=Rhagoletis pomonella TaxID=28610 RepID=UPI00177AC2F6|nr:transport and Golgi organization protein 2-like isoform X1 [Rhagoletis pomonella]XP_036342545.1 transport and Golgi organization protein 2-like isoform X1 [Rhagoletis pomonella]XP_036342546.1 transport and Golgi organization protein 2-like isoform X1 [Rhagoletis pomonella]
MCVIFIYVNSNPNPGGYKLILASNRDEFYARDTQDAAKWANAEHVYGGIDLEPGREGGTWLAIGGHGGVFKVGALLNLTGEPKPRNAVVNGECVAKNHNIIYPNHNDYKADTTRIIKPADTSSLLHNEHFLLGRGMIVSNFAASKDDCNIQGYNSELLSECTKYSAFNFVSIEIGSKAPANILLLSNTPPGLEHFAEGKCYGFGNSLASAPFQKVINGRQRFQNIVEDFHSKLATAPTEAMHNMQADLVTNLKNLLKCEHKFWPDAELARRAPNWGEYLSALNVSVPSAGYGSRTHTVILIDGQNKMHFYEDTMAGPDPKGEWRQTHIEKQYFQNENSTTQLFECSKI